MSTRTPETNTDMRPEYDFSDGVRGKYAATLREEGYTIREYNADSTFTETRVLGEDRHYADLKYPPKLENATLYCSIEDTDVILNLPTML